MSVPAIGFCDIRLFTPETHQGHSLINGQAESIFVIQAAEIHAAQPNTCCISNIHGVLPLQALLQHGRVLRSGLLVKLVFEDVSIPTFGQKEGGAVRRPGETIQAVVVLQFPEQAAVFQRSDANHILFSIRCQKSPIGRSNKKFPIHWMIGCPKPGNRRRRLK